MDGITESDALTDQPLKAGERANFLVARAFDNLECLTATFITHAYARHTHETYVLGAIYRGCETWFSRGAQHYAGPGDCAFVHPGDVHDGEPADDGYSYRMIYPSVGLLRDIAESVTGRPSQESPYFREAKAHDPIAARLFSRAHRALADGEEGLLLEESLHRVLAHCLVRYAGAANLALNRESGPVARVRDLMDARYQEDHGLDQLATIARLPRHQLIRAFQRDTGFTPHAYLIHRRVLAAKSLLRAGASPSDAASDVGFFDQSHLTRAFKARLGVTPGAYRAAFHA
jgi:AraC-like DNA-binding protein